MTPHHISDVILISHSPMEWNAHNILEMKLHVMDIPNCKKISMGKMYNIYV
jgi:hypothetical protein